MALEGPSMRTHLLDGIDNERLALAPPLPLLLRIGLLRLAAALPG